MVDIVIDSATLQTIIAAAIPLIALVVDYLKKKLSNEQGAMAFSIMKDWANRVKELSLVFPDLAPISEDLTEIVDRAETLWKDPANNSAELALIFAKSSSLFSKAMDLVSKYGIAKTSTEVKGA